MKGYYTVYKKMSDKTISLVDLSAELNVSLDHGSLVSQLQALGYLNRRAHTWVSGDYDSFIVWGKRGIMVIGDRNH